MNRDQQRNKLKDWLEAYAIWQQLCPEGPESEGFESKAAPESGGGEGPDFSEETALAWGQIRLWPAGALDDAPLYGLLVSPEYGTWGVLPFSPLPVPGTPKELKVLEAPPVQVVQGWNRRRISAALARQSWCAGRLPDAESVGGQLGGHFALEMFLAWIEAGGEIPAVLADRVGPPLVHPLDPRFAYCDDERGRVNRGLGEASMGGGIGGGTQDVPFSRAAEPEGDYDA